LLDGANGCLSCKFEPDEKEEQTLRASKTPTPHDGNHADKSGGNGKPAPAVSTITDEQLLESYRHGNKAAFAQLVERYQRELFHFLVRFLGDRTAAEDVFQESFLQVHQSAAQFDPTRRFRPWLFTIAANKARDLMRSQARRPTNPLQATISPGDEEWPIYRLMEAQSTPGQNMEREELQKLVHGTVMTCPSCRKFCCSPPDSNISRSAILAIPLGTVKSRLHAAAALCRPLAGSEANKSVPW
jgi:RNA polymerase sigma-70 factor (ECF subfamily)